MPLARPLFTLTAATSVLLTLALCTLWSRSYDRSDKLTWTRDDGVQTLRSAQGRVVLGLYLASRPNPNTLAAAAATARPLRYERVEAASPDVELFSILVLCSDASTRLVQWNRAGFAWNQRRSRYDLIVHAVAPFWSLALSASLPALAWTTLRLRRSHLGRSLLRDREGHPHCPTCNYDLHATPHRCPECGATPVGASPHAAL
jgi:hypothetical protein